MTSIPLSAHSDDARLVERSRAGDTDAFGEIVARYQSVVCALAYSATGNRSRSEDLAQETFVTAWRNLAALREPNRLRAWLCGVARNVIQGEIRRLGRQPAHGADALEAVAALPGSEPLPTAQAVSNEEMAILWREVGRLPEMYREPLVLYYRGHKAIEEVAEALELTPDAAMQRLSRGRRMLQERMLEFVETTLQRTNPGQGFTLQVTAALPLLAGAGPAVAATAAGSGGAAAKGGVVGFLLTWLAPLLGLFAAAGVTWMDLKSASSRRERRYVGRWMLALWLCAGLFTVALPLVGRWSYNSGLSRRGDWLATAPMVGLWFALAMITGTLVVLMARGRAALRREASAEAETAGGGSAPAPQAPVLWRVATVVGFLIALFWVPVFVAWMAGDRRVAGLIVGIVAALVVVAGWVGRHQHSREDEAKSGGWYVAACALVFLAILNWRLDTWLAAIFGVEMATMHRLLPMGLVHGLSLVAIGWISALVYFTRPRR